MSRRILFTAVLVTGVSLLGISLHHAIAQTSEIFPAQATNFVTDLANVIDDATESELNQKLFAFQTETSNEIAVATLPTLDGRDIEGVANEMFRAWGIGDKERNNGILVLVIPTEREYRIEVGYGLEGAVPDLLAKQIAEDEMVPSFREENYGAGIASAVDSLILATRGEYEAIAQKPSSSPSPFVWVVIAMFAFEIIYSILAPTKSWWLGGVLGVIGGGIFGIIVSSLVFGIVGAIGLGIAGLIFDYFISKTFKKRPWRSGGGGFWGGGGSSGFGGGGSSFGGFGGGSSGGGGASGRW